MTKQLSDTDGQAVDLLLDRPDAEFANGKNIIGAELLSPHRIQSVEKILSQLQHIPASEPPPDLVMRTMQRVDSAKPVAKPIAKSPPPIAPPAPDAAHNHRPIA